ncbi:uncharacterized protein MONOS_5209 [Monocercomonoides exilis]|uniref:uncharacterized protein n=1 Tax=Monocercomonoides exilis TaxID=2049356 RepID=UPI003559B1CB|nr:hypothetical protein MONOS_5209 [Monocercomonoides exilis]|eukprot:MONOS_5209.1-p1 / transcript=MONOS_5209.1 / gene=MONOS_5209 / organism=Monocercomonoides_exilis_PA203 / gene_product=unspecified product / transcript_product=unspecified product / location=Mono_scaffold00149:43300-44246(+) / protein_length=240 / sequence_SO=supercontig / SO=protein_coding / is_pseudo=false
MEQVPLANTRGRPPKMRRKKMITAMGLSQQGQKCKGGASANVTVQNARSLESTVATSETVLSELLSRELELLGVADDSITFDSSESDTSEMSGRSRSDIEGNEDDEEVEEEEEEEKEEDDEDEEEEEEEEDVELDRILSAKISLTSTRASRKTPKKSRSVFEYDASSTFNSAKMRENSSIETTFKAAEMKERQKREAVTKLKENALKLTHGRIIPTINPTDFRLYANLVQEEESKAKKQ